MAANVSSDGVLRKRALNGQSKVVAPSEEGKKTDQKLDQHLEYVSFNFVPSCLRLSDIFHYFVILSFRVYIGMSSVDHGALSLS